MKGRSTVPPLLTESSRSVRGAQKQSRNTSRSSRWKEKDQKIFIRGSRTSRSGRQAPISAEVLIDTY
ncbi:hypothetical protein DWZ96_14190 [Clostridium sp. AF36-18BH]|nr:hypothetical protein DWZ96_14190 [Clostridium sp. AF36-18BH]